MTKIICKMLGISFVVLGVIGFIMPGLLGTHLSPAHNLVHIISGAVAMWFGWKGSPKAAKAFSLTFGAAYGLLGIAGFFAPPGMPSMAGMEPSDHLLKVIPGVLELGTNDSILHIIVGAIFLLAGFSKNKTAELPQQSTFTPPPKVGV
jgi:hypothetical protein